METDHEITTTATCHLPLIQEGLLAVTSESICTKYWLTAKPSLGPSIKGLVTDGNTKLCCRGFILALFQSNTANKIDSEHTKVYKRLLPVCEAEILRASVKRIEVFSSFYVAF